MRRKAIFVTILCLAMVRFAGALGANAGEVDYRAIAERTLGQHIRPAYAALAKRTRELEQKATALCGAPSPAGKAALDEAFAEALKAWSGIEHIRFGPVMEENRIFRFAYWPDRKGLGRKQVLRALASRPLALTDPDQLTKQSVAVQGLTALEYLLFGRGHESLAKPGEDGAFRCAFARAITVNLARMARTVKAGWADGAPYVQAFLHPTEKSSSFRSHKEVVLEIYQGLKSALQQVADLKMRRALGKEPAMAKPKRLPFWRSGLAGVAILANVQALHGLFSIAFAELVAGFDPGVDRSMLFEFSQSEKILLGLRQPLSKAVASPETWGKLNAMTYALANLHSLAEQEIAQAAQLSLGFNALDGD